MWWELSRASGLVSLALAWLALILGVTLSGRLSTTRGAPKWLLDLHRFAGALSLLFVAVHLVALWADSYVTFDLADLLVPGVADWRTTAVAFGVLAMWLLVAVEVSSLWMRKLPRRTWRLIHLSSYVAAVSATVHELTAGTDATHPAVLLLTIAVVGLAVFVTTYRVVADRRRPRASTSARTSARSSSTVPVSRPVPADEIASA